MPICPCSLIKAVSPNGTEPLNFGHVRRLAQLGASKECYTYVFKHFEGKTMRALFPECYETQEQKPKIKINNITVNKTTINLGESIDVRVYISDNSSVGGNVNVRLTVDGNLVAQKSTYVNPYSSIALVFNNIKVNNVGRHTICAEV